MKCKFVGLSDPGRVRANNEDAIVMEAGLGLAVLADGMGGYNAGEIASAMAVEHTLRHVQELHACQTPSDIRQVLCQSIAAANLAVHQASLTQADRRGMGTTLVAAWFQGDQVTIAHVGDSRAYRLRQGRLAPLTKDHSLLQEQIDAGLVDPGVARFANYRNLITRAVGVEPTVKVDVGQHTVLPGDVHLLCSDGLNDMLTDEEMAALLVRTPTLQAAAEALIAAANAAGGRDNISLILVQHQPEPAVTIQQTPDKATPRS